MLLMGDFISPQPMLGPYVLRPEGSRILGSLSTDTWAGHWNAVSTYLLLDVECMWGRNRCRREICWPTGWKMDDFRRESCHRVWSREHRMTAWHWSVGGIRRQTTRRAETSSHVAGWQWAGWVFSERVGTRKSILGSGECRRLCREQSWVVSEHTGPGSWYQLQPNTDLLLIRKSFEQCDWH